MKSNARTKCVRSEQAGFTLIELLVVISIIALLLSLLLPSMTGARRTGQRVACAATLRHISEGMQQYGQDNDDAILGSPDTSGAYLVGEGQAWGGAVQQWDFMGPLARAWGMGFVEPSKGDAANVVAKRFDQIRSSGAFLCPGNKFLSMKFNGPDAGAGWMISYNTYRYSLWSGASWPGSHEEMPPANWKPVIGRMGVPADKVYCGDGARYIEATTHVNDYDLSVAGPYGGAFSDSGAYSTFSRSWDRCWAPGNAKEGPSEARYFAYRHTTAEPPAGAGANVFKGNFAFYDGHVEGQGDLQSANPFQWLPSGSRLQAAGCWPDAIAQYGLSGTINIGQQ